MQKDPVCGMMVDERKTKFQSIYQGKTFYFCSSVCKTTWILGGSDGSRVTLDPEPVTNNDQ
ncbi:YHS domain-containing protein [Candidatus Bathyarchaeota archaeon]|nr:MAG: YHS domain-containing protein [Candidatus Bathyarchaeota archaeon]TMI20843.1 MAG: YHS domain-containing protein [Candidatus Bathyarchaeota archaeon]